MKGFQGVRVASVFKVCWLCFPNNRPRLCLAGWYVREWYGVGFEIGLDPWCEIFIYIAPRGGIPTYPDADAGTVDLIGKVKAWAGWCHAAFCITILRQRPEDYLARLYWKRLKHLDARDVQAGDDPALHGFEYDKKKRYEILGEIKIAPAPFEGISIKKGD